MTNDKKSVYATTYEVLVGVSKLIAPFAPFISDEIYTNLTGEESVHLAFIPMANADFIDEAVTEKMDLVRRIVTLGRGIREKERIKVRQPLSAIKLDGKYESIIADLLELIKEELNVKEVVFETKLDEFLTFSLKPNFKEAGPKLGKDIKEFGKVLATVDPADFITRLEDEKEVKLSLNGVETVVTADMVDINISAKDGFAVAMENKVFTILDTHLTNELIEEGFAREVISKIQQLRKQSGFEMMDNIKVYLKSTDKVESAVTRYKDYILSETLGVEIVSDARGEEFDINGEKANIGVERV